MGDKSQGISFRHVPPINFSLPWLPWSESSCKSSEKTVEMW